MRVHTGEKPYKCDFCDFFCAMKGNLKSHVRMKHNSQSMFQCLQCDFQCGSKANLRQHIREHQPEQPVKCSECSYTCSNRAALKVHERIHSKDRPFKCHFCTFDTKQRSNLTTHTKKTHGDKVKPKKAAPERREGDLAKQCSSRQAGKLVAKRAFKCDVCEASFVREDSLRSHKKQHNEYNVQKSSEVAVLELQIDPSRQSNALLSVRHIQVPIQPNQVAPYNEGRVKIIVGHQLPDQNNVETTSMNAGSSDEATQVQEHISSNQLQILRQSGTTCIAHQTVLLTTHDQNGNNALHQALIPNGEVNNQESPANQTFTANSGISCTDLEGLNALIQEGTAEVTVVSEGGENITLSASEPSPIFSTSSQVDEPKQNYTIIQGDLHSALLCPADSIPD
ncbi:hypothetical protein FKM82_022911 [Ascaphus truei]